MPARLDSTPKTLSGGPSGSSSAVFNTSSSGSVSGEGTSVPRRSRRWMPSGKRRKGAAERSALSLHLPLLRVPIPFPVRMVLIVGIDDIFHELVTHDVVPVKITELDPIDFMQNVADLDQTGYRRRRQVDLRDVAGDNGLRVSADSGQKHLHLHARRVLRLIQYNKRIVQRSAPHIGKRHDFDHPPLDVGLELLRGDHIVEGVV